MVRSEWLINGYRHESSGKIFIGIGGWNFPPAASCSPHTRDASPVRLFRLCRGWFAPPISLGGLRSYLSHCLAVYGASYFGLCCDHASNRSRPVSLPPAPRNSAMPILFHSGSSTCGSFGMTAIAAASSPMSISGGCDPFDPTGRGFLLTSSISQSGASAMGRSCSHLYTPSLRIEGGAMTLDEAADYALSSA